MLTKIFHFSIFCLILNTNISYAKSFITNSSVDFLGTTQMYVQPNTHTNAQVDSEINAESNSQINTQTNTQTNPATAPKANVVTETPKTDSLEPPSTIEVQYQNEKNLFLPRFKNYIALYKPSYILPYYYTKSPDYPVYIGQIPNNQTLQHTEFKGQLSVYLPLIKNLFYNKNISINIGYTQLIYWQLYTGSPWFRETNYEPDVSLVFRIVRNIFGEVTFNHQSNGRGGDFERSWNRFIGTLEFSTPDLFVQLNGWVQVFKGGGATNENPDIAHYLGYDKIIVSYRILKKLVLSVEANNIESGYTRGFYMFTASYPLTPKVGLYAQYFNGYGQSLIEYNHRTQAFGIGFNLNDWQ